MDEITAAAGVQLVLDAILGDRLAVLCGAGLSMDSPSKLPSAAALASAAKQKYDATHGITRPPLSPNIDEQAEFFFQRGELETVYLNTLIDQHAFASPPNAGHSAIADLLLVRAIQTAVSTNVDSLIETAGMMLFGQIGVGIDRNSVAALPANVSPLLKIHGSWDRDRANTVWAHGQLLAEPILSSIQGSKKWLAVQLLDRDLLIVGYWTDWDYLNDVLEATLGEVRPARVIVVDPSDGAWLEKKAPVLNELGKRATATFKHVTETGAVFLDNLRSEFSRTVVRRVLYSGVDLYEEASGDAVDPTWKEPPLLNADDYWRVRRDLEGSLPDAPALRKVPYDEPLLGLTLLQLRAKGGVAEGPLWLLAGRRVRVLRTANQLLHKVKAEYSGEFAPVVAPDVVIAVGAEESPLPAHLVRGTIAASITRGMGGLWLTRTDAVRELALA